jgi:hypothetical protein
MKGKVHNVTVLEVSEGEYRYSSTFSLTSALSGVGGQRRAPARFTHRERDPVPILQKVLRIFSEISMTNLRNRSPCSAIH